MGNWIPSKLEISASQEETSSTSSASSSPVYEGAGGVKINSKKANVVNRRNKYHHNKVEQKYRANLIEKFVDLRNAVPTLRAASPTSNVSATELEGLLPAAKVNKATILTKATEYIKYLESKNEILMNTVQSLNTSCATPTTNQQFAQACELPPVQPQYSDRPHRAYSDISTAQNSYNTDLAPYSGDYSGSYAAPGAYAATDCNASYVQTHQDSLPAYQEIHQDRFAQQDQHDPQFQPYVQHNPAPFMHHQSSVSGGADVHYADPNPPSTVYAHAYPDQNQSNIPMKIMAGTLACFTGAEFLDSQYDNNYKGFSIIPVDPLYVRSAIGLLKWFSILVCGISMLYPYFQSGKRKESEPELNLLPTTPSSFIINLALGSLTRKDPRAKDVTKFPTSSIGRLVLYIQLSNIAQDSDYMLEVSFIKLLLLGLTITKHPMLSYLTGLASRKQLVRNKILALTKDKPSKLGDYFKNFSSRKSTYAEVEAILLSYSQHHSTKEVISDVFGNGFSYNSVAEYLEMTPIRSMNLFELFSLIGVLDVIKLNFVKYLNDILINNYSIPDDKVSILLKEIETAENYIPTTCFKLIKCCNLFKCLLDPANKAYLDDALKTILSCIEQSIAEKYQNDIHDDTKVQLLQIIRNSDLNIVEKIISFLQIAKASDVSSQYLCDDNRLSLVCILILHYYSIGMVDKATELIPFLKRDKSKKFASDNSVSLVSLIATYKALFVILNNQRENYSKSDNTGNVFIYGTYPRVSSISDISDLETDPPSKEYLSMKDKFILEDLISGIRLYLSHNGDTEGAIDADILNLHYGLKSELSHKLLQLAKDLVGYNFT